MTRSDSIYVHASDDCGINWKNKTPISEKTRCAPALALFRDRLFVAFTGTTGQLNVKWSWDGVTWLPVNKKTLTEESPAGPSLAVFNNMLFLLWCGKDNYQLNLLPSDDGLNWNPDRKIVLGDKSDSAPAMAVDDGMPFLCWRGHGDNQNLNQMTSRDSDLRKFGYKRTFGDTSPRAPVLTAFQHRIYLAWTGDVNMYPNVAVLSLGAVSAYGLLS